MKSNPMSPELQQQWEEMKAILPWLVGNLKQLQGQASGVSNETGSSGPDPAVIVSPPAMLAAQPPSSTRHSVDLMVDGPSDGPQRNPNTPMDPDISPSPPPPAPRHSSAARSPPPPAADARPVVTLRPMVVGNGDNEAAGDEGGEEGETNRANQLREAWLLAFQDKYSERSARSSSRTQRAYNVSIRHTPFGFTFMPVAIEPAGYRLTELPISGAELSKTIAAAKTAPTPSVDEVRRTLPLETGVAIKKLLKYRRYRRPSVELIVREKPSAWHKLTGKRRKTPSITVYLSCKKPRDEEEDSYAESCASSDMEYALSNTEYALSRDSDEDEEEEHEGWGDGSVDYLAGGAMDTGDDARIGGYRRVARVVSECRRRPLPSSTPDHRTFENFDNYVNTVPRWTRKDASPVVVDSTERENVQFMDAFLEGLDRDEGV